MKYEPEPMDPADLARLRELADNIRVEMEADFLVAELVELLAHVAYQERRAEQAERDLDFFARLTGSAIVRATVIAPGEKVIEYDEAIAGHALTGAVEKLRARAERAEQERDEARAEVARLRDRVRVEAEDVERAGVTREHVAAWLRANGWDAAFYAGGRLTLTLICPRSTHYVHADGWHIPSIVNDLAERLGRLGLDILDEMAATPLEPETK